MAVRYTMWWPYIPHDCQIYHITVRYIMLLPGILCYCQIYHMTARHTTWLSDIPPDCQIYHVTDRYTVLLSDIPHDCQICHMTVRYTTWLSGISCDCQIYHITVRYNTWLSGIPRYYITYLSTTKPTHLSDPALHKPARRHRPTQGFSFRQWPLWPMCWAPVSGGFPLSKPDLQGARLRVAAVPG